MKTTATLIGMVAFSLAALVGCRSAGVYEVHAHHAETVPGKVDGVWFTRAVRSERQETKAVELVYCPIVPNGPMVCRTAIIWEDGHSQLIEKN